MNIHGIKKLLYSDIHHKESDVMWGIASRLSS